MTKIKELEKERAGYNARRQDVYAHLLAQPTANGVEMTSGTSSALERLEERSSECDERMDKEVLWTVEGLEGKLMELFGGLEAVDRGLLPVWCWRRSGRGGLLGR